VKSKGKTEKLLANLLKSNDSLTEGQLKLVEGQIEANKKMSNDSLTEGQLKLVEGQIEANKKMAARQDYHLSTCSTLQ